MISEDKNSEWLLHLRQPLLKASTLPPSWYTSEEVFEAEKREIFLTNWLFVGREEQIQTAGEYFCYEGVGGSVIIVRSDQGDIKAFANTCRHRGAKLLSGQGKCRRIVCPYHSWVYKNDGDLIGAPQMDHVEDFKISEFSLLDVSLETYDGFIFINYAPNPESLLSQLGNFPETFASHNSASMRHVHSIEFDVRSNWKLLAENALEAYHTGTVHAETLGQQDSSAIKTSTDWTGLLVEDEDSVATMEGEVKPFPHLASLSEEAKKGAFFTLVYPSTQFVFAQDCMWWLKFEPISVNQTHLTLGACFPETSIELPQFEEQLSVYIKRWTLATEEDNKICEAQQLGQQFTRPPGRYAPEEFAVHHFSNWIADQIFKDRQ